MHIGDNKSRPRKKYKKKKGILAVFNFKVIIKSSAINRQEMWEKIKRRKEGRKEESKGGREEAKRN